MVDLQSIGKKIGSISASKLLLKKVLKEVRFHPEGERCPKTVGSGMVKVKVRRWDGKWQIAS